MDIARTYEATKAKVAQLQATPTRAEVVHDIGTRKPKRQDDSCMRCWLNHGDIGKFPAHEHKCGKGGRPTTWHDPARPNKVVAAEHPIASEADRLPALVRVVIKGHTSTRLQTTLRHWYFRLSVWTASAMTKRTFVTLSLSIVKDKRPTALKAKMDTGAQAKFLPWRIYQQMDRPENSLKPSTTTLVSYTGTPILQHGIWGLYCTFKGEKKSRKHWDLRLSDFRHGRNSESSPSIAKCQRTAAHQGHRRPNLAIPGVFSGHQEVHQTVPHYRRLRSTASCTSTTASPVQKWRRRSNKNYRRWDSKESSRHCEKANPRHG